jgi:hypothetical protein
VTDVANADSLDLRAVAARPQAGVPTLRRAALMLLAAGGALTPLVVAVGFFDPFYIGKFAVVLATGAGLAGCLAWWAGRHRLVVLPPRVVHVPLAALVATLLLATFASPHPLRSVAGAHGRYSGLGLLLACLLALLAGTAVFTTRAVRTWVGAVLAAAVPVLAYAIAQWQGVDPMGWEERAGGPQVFSTLGNRNFLAGWAAIIVPLGIVGSRLSGWTLWQRAGAGAIGVCAGFATVMSASWQGPAAAGAALAVLLIADVTAPDTSQWRRRAAQATAVLGATAGLVVAWGIGPGHGLRSGLLDSLQRRLGKWEAAVGMGLDRPLTGQGLDLFADGLHRFRPLWEAVERGIHPTTDAAHNVPLQLLAGGGVPLFVAYLATVVGVAVVLRRGLQRTDGERRLLLGGAGAAWVGYQVQALVSIDLPHLAALHWLLAGAVVALGAEPSVLRLPRRAARLVAVALALVGVALVAIGGLSVAADRAAGDAAALDNQRRVVAAEQRSALALRLAPWEPRYALVDARRRARRDDLERTLIAYAEVRRRQPYSIVATVELARLQVTQGLIHEAASTYTAALVIDPTAPVLLAEVAAFELAHGDEARAAELLEQALAAKEVADWWFALADARTALGDSEGARTARARGGDAPGDRPTDDLHQPAPSLP